MQPFTITVGKYFMKDCLMFISKSDIKYSADNSRPLLDSASFSIENITLYDSFVLSGRSTYAHVTNVPSRSTCEEMQNT